MKYCSFCAANSGDGFISFFDEILDEKKKNVFYIKGGPGCGKSTLLNKIAQEAESAELIYCSGDPQSLDGVILPKENTVIIDATSPHSHEPKYPGVGGNLIDLGIIWDPQKLNKEKIIQLSDKKKKIYTECYSLLNSTKAIHLGVFLPLIEEVPIKKIKIIVDKILRQNGLWEQREKKAIVEKRFISAISADGLLTLNETIQSLCSNIILLEDRWMIASSLLEYLHQSLKERGIDHICCYHPLLGKQTIQHILIPELKTSILSKDPLFNLEIQENNIIRRVIVQNLLPKDQITNQKNKFNFIRKLEKELLLSSVELLKEARAIHLQIESEYSRGTNFNLSASLRNNLLFNLFGLT